MKFQILGKWAIIIQYSFWNTEMNSNDKIRENILEYLYEVNKNSRSPGGAEKGIQHLQKELKTRFAYKQQDVSSNLNYLIDKKWVIRSTTSKEFTTGGGTVLHPQKTTYRISAEGIDYIEGPSRFKSNSISNINIHNISGIVTVGDFNSIVNTEYKDLFKELENLHRKILDEKSFNDEQRLNLSSDIESLKNQLSKTTPNKGLIAKLWEGIQLAANVDSCIQLISTISSLIPH